MIGRHSLVPANPWLRPWLLALLVLGACAGPFGASPAVEELYRKAGEGDVQSQYLLAMRLTNGRGVSQDYGAGVQWFTKSALGGHAKGQYMLGVALSAGRGVDRDFVAAIAWYERAAVQGHARAQYQLGDAYANGRGVGKEPAWAVRWLEMAAERGHVEAQFTLGVSFAFGLGVAVDTVAAATWLMIAGESGHAQGKESLEALAAKMTSAEVARSRRLAVRWPAGSRDSLAAAPTVRFVEHALKRLGYDPGGVDGEAGAEIRAAIEAYRRTNGLAPGGEVTEDLITDLRRGLAALDKPGS